MSNAVEAPSKFAANRIEMKTYAMNEATESAGESVRPIYRADIDGLRAVAVIAVVIFHAFPGAIPGGFIGVDIFFVISGFLISTIVFESLERSEFSLREFYGRRVRRIFPALIVVLIVSLLFGWFALLTDEYSRLGKHVAGGAAFISNIVSLKEGGYFDTAAGMKPMLHLWSLAIEEQFYLFWPLLVAYVWKRRISFLKLTAVVAMLSFAVNIYLVGRHPTTAFYSPLSRFWELMIGAVLAYIALHAPELNRNYKNAQSACGFLLLIIGFMFVDAGGAFPGWWALLPTLAGFLIISAGPASWLNRNVLSNRGLVWFGLISYPLYLWHWPLLSFARIVSGIEPPVELRIAIVISSVPLAWLTYRFIEKPFRSGMQSGRKVFFAAGLMGCVSAAAGLAYSGVLKPRNTYPALEAASRVGDFEYLTNLAGGSQDLSGIYTIESASPDITVLIGDSHVAQYAPRMGDLIKKHADANTAVFAVSGGCPPIPNVFEGAEVHDKCGEIRENALRLVKQANVKVVVFGAAWSQYFVDQTRYPKKEPTDYDYYFLNNGIRAYFRNGNGAELALMSLERLLARLGKQKQVYLLLDNPVGENLDPHSFLSRHFFASMEMTDSRRLTKIDLPQLRIREELIDIAKRAGVQIVDPFTKLCRDEICERWTGDDEPVYKDGSHLSASWIERYGDYVDKTVVRH